MDLIEDNYNYNFKNASQFTDQLNSLKQQLPAVLDDFEKYYVFYNMNSSNTEYQNMFENIKNNLNSINSKSFVISNDVDKSINDVNTKLSSLNLLIEQEKKTNKELEAKMAIIKQKGNSADIRISNFKQMYDIGYLKNWALFLSILIAGYAISKVSNNKIIVPIIKK
jgi:esterase/lipase